MSRKELEASKADGWRDMMPRIREVVWDMRAAGQVEILQKGEVLGDDIGLDDIKGPIRIRLKLDDSE
jgi:hypothetical protein